jgi:hypothetical protein
MKNPALSIWLVATGCDENSPVIYAHRLDNLHCFYSANMVSGVSVQVSVCQRARYQRRRWPEKQPV